MKRTVFVLLGVIAAAPSWAHTPDDNSVIDSYRQYLGAGGPPKVISNPTPINGMDRGTPDDNFIQNTTMRENSDSYLDDQNDRRRRAGVYQDENDEDDP